MVANFPSPFWTYACTQAWRWLSDAAADWKIESRLNFSISLENFNLAWKMFNLDLHNLIFHSLVFWISLVFSNQRKIPWCFFVFSAVCQGFLGSEWVKFLGVLGGSPWFLPKDQGTEDPGTPIENTGLVGSSLEIFNLAWEFQSRRAILRIFNLWALGDSRGTTLCEALREICLSSTSFSGALAWGLHWKGFNHIHVQTKGGYQIFSVPETCEFTKPPGSYEFCGFPFRKNQERASKIGSILGGDQGLVNTCSAAVGRAINWTGRTLNSSYYNYSFNRAKT